MQSLLRIVEVIQKLTTLKYQWFSNTTFHLCLVLVSVPAWAALVSYFPSSGSLGFRLLPFFDATIFNIGSRGTVGRKKIMARTTLIIYLGSGKNICHFCSHYISQTSPMASLPCRQPRNGVPGWAGISQVQC